MALIWITFIWLILLIVYYAYKWQKEKKENMIISKEGRSKYFKGRYLWK